jgi:hypothetical protein
VYIVLYISVEKLPRHIHPSFSSTTTTSTACGQPVVRLACVWAASYFLLSGNVVELRWTSAEYGAVLFLPVMLQPRIRATTAVGSTARRFACLVPVAISSCCQRVGFWASNNPTTVHMYNTYIRICSGPPCDLGHCIALLGLEPNHLKTTCSFES